MHAVIWRGASVEDLGTLGDGTHSAALGINSQGDVVGVSDTGDYTCPSACFPVQHAFLYREGVMRDLNDLIPVDSGWELVVATAINDSGQIVASGRDAAGWNRALLLNPSPSGRIQGLIDLVISFDLPKGPENSLVTKLEHALASLEGGDSQTACSQLGAFINEVRAQSGNKLTTEQADELIADATAIRALLGCS
jgi:probable HAF family extracellular repeat protein